jgi:hypothetical protein
MKKIFTFILIVSLTSAIAQDHPFPVADASWAVVTEFYMGGFPPDTGRITETFVYDGTKLLNGHDYSQVFITQEPVYIPGSSLNYFKGYIREENDVVYYMYIGMEEELILYDFNLQPGDVAPFFTFCCGSSYDVSLHSIDSILIGDEYRRRFIFDTIWDYSNMLAEVWIEGIGSVHGLFHPSTVRLYSGDLPDAINLTCFEHEGLNVWSNPSYNMCYMNTLTAIPEKTIENYSIKPNPAKDYFKVSLDEASGPYQINLYNLTGSRVLSTVTSGANNQAVVSVRHLRAGLYLVEIVNSKTDHRHVSKLLIE